MISSTRLLCGLIGLGLILPAANIVWQPFVPLVDLPNHLARHVLEADWLAGRELPPFYEIDYRVIPNLGADLAMPILLQVLEPGAACKLFLILAVVLYWLGPAVYFLQMCGDRSGAVCAALLWLPLVFSSQFFWGFLNYYSGFGLAFLVLAHWVRLLTSERARNWEWPLHALMVTFLFLWHLAAWGIYGVMAGSHVLVALWGRLPSLPEKGRLGSLPHGLRSLAALIAVCLPSLALLVIYMLDKSDSGLGETNWGTILRKLYMPLTLFRGYHFVADGLVIATWLTAVVALMAGRRETVQTAEVSKTSAVLGPALGLAILSVLYVAIPFQLGSTSDTDSRLLPAMLVSLLAILASFPARRSRWGLALVAVCILVRQIDVFLAWQERCRRLEIHAEAFAHLERHSRILPLVLVPEQSKYFPEQHSPCWAVVTHRAYVSTLFALRDQQPLVLKAPREHVALYTAGVWLFDAPKLRRDYDFVWLYNPEDLPVLVPPSCVEVFARDGLTLFRVHP